MTKINIFSPGRYHVCDLARQLNKQGFDVRFYSYVPAKRTMRFGLPRKCIVSLFVPMIPFLVLKKISGGYANRLIIKFQDWLSCTIMRKADVCICMSGAFLLTPRKAKKNGATVILERGSKHILEQRRILEAIPINKDKKPVPDFNVERELAGYEIADYISVASQCVAESFRIYNFPLSKLFINPYGVDLSDFYPASNIEKKFDLLMVGGWGYRKGCDLITEAVRLTGCTFLHVGAIGDLSFPNEKGFNHHDSVDQKNLVTFYNQAKVFILPSREEGMTMVQMQAIACNLPLIGSHDSGAEDLKQMVQYPQYITIIKDYSIESIIGAIKMALANYDTLSKTGKAYIGNAKEKLSWEAYGKRYARFLDEIIKRQQE